MSLQRKNKTKEEGNNYETPVIYGRYFIFNSKKENQRALYAPKTKDKIFLTGVKPNWPKLNSVCLIAGGRTGSKNSIWIFKYDHYETYTPLTPANSNGSSGH
jgi:hypothetical protein